MFPNAERIGRETVTLPLFPAMRDSDVDRVVERGQPGAGSDRVKPQVSVVIPVFNEGAGLPLLFARLFPALDALGRSYEVIFVDDGSRDNSVGLAARSRGGTSGPRARRRAGAQCRPAPGHPRRLRARARQRRGHAGCRSAESAGRNRRRSRRAGGRRRLCRHDSRDATGLLVAQRRLALSSTASASARRRSG